MSEKKDADVLTQPTVAAPAAPPSYHETVQRPSSSKREKGEKGSREIAEDEENLTAVASSSASSSALVASSPSQYAGSPDWAPQASDRQLTALDRTILVAAAAQRRNGEKKASSAALNIPSFQRTPGSALGQTYARFVNIDENDTAAAADNAISIPSLRGQDEIEFKPHYPGAQLVDHDVSSADWAAFLEDLLVATRYSTYQKAYASISPVTKRLTFVGAIATSVVGRATTTTTDKAVYEVVERWNEHCFQKRKLDVYIHNGHSRLTARGVKEAVPPLPKSQQKRRANTNDSDSSSDSDSDSYSSLEDKMPPQPGSKRYEERLAKYQYKLARRQQKQERRQARRQRREARREAKRDRREEKSRKRQRGIHWLVIAAM